MRKSTMSWYTLVKHHLQPSLWIHQTLMSSFPKLFSTSNQKQKAHHVLPLSHSIHNVYKTNIIIWKDAYPHPYTLPSTALHIQSKLQSQMHHNHIQESKTTTQKSFYMFAYTYTHLLPGYHLIFNTCSAHLYALSYWPKVEPQTNHMAAGMYMTL